MNYKIPDNIKILCEKDSLADPKEQELVKRELVKFIKAYLTLGDENDEYIGRNSLANITDITSEKGEFPVKGKNYPFERDIAGRMMRTKNYTMKEGLNWLREPEVYVIAADRDFWDKHKGPISVGLLVFGFILGLIGDAVKERIFTTKTNKSNPDTISVKVLQLPKPAGATSGQKPAPSNPQITK